MLYKIFAFLSFSLMIFYAQSQNFCFVNPNTGPHYHNGSAGAVYDVVSGDFNNDGHEDIVTANSTGGSISFIPGFGDATLGSPDTFAAHEILFAINAADLNKDGNLDIVTASNFRVKVFYGNGDGTFQNYKEFQGSDQTSRIYLEDLNNDQRTDIIIAGGSKLTILHQVNNNLFTFPFGIPAGGDITDLSYDYFDNDTIKDIVAVVHEKPTLSKLSFFKGNSVGQFSLPVSQYVPMPFIFGVTSIDIDKNGTNDLIVSNSSVQVSRLEIYHGNGNGTFASPVFHPAMLNPSYLYQEDVDDDGTMDVIAVEGSGFSIFKNKGDGTLATFEYFASMPSPNGLAIADFNEDGKLDIVVPSGSFGSGLIGMNVNCATTGIAEVNNLTSLELFPNPTAGIINIHYSLTDPAAVELHLTDITGRIVTERVKSTDQSGDFTHPLPLEMYPAGIYLLRLTVDGMAFTERVVKL